MMLGRTLEGTKSDELEIIWDPCLNEVPFRNAPESIAKSKELFTQDSCSPNQDSNTALL
jgi:hypothetical protein